MIHDKDKLWVSILSHKYLGNVSILDALLPADCSSIWRAICKSASLIKDGFRVRLGNGSSSFWFHPWIRKGSLCNLADFIHVTDSQLKVQDSWEEGCWKLDNIWTLLLVEVQQLILEVPVPHFRDSPDCLVWTGAFSGSYSVSSTYGWLMSKHHGLDIVESWRWVWRLETPFKICFLVW